MSEKKKLVLASNVKRSYGQLMDHFCSSHLYPDPVNSTLLWVPGVPLDWKREHKNQLEEILRSDISLPMLYVTPGTPSTPP